MVKLTCGQEWFDGQKQVWNRVVKPLFMNRKFCRAIEIGTWEGGSACWILNNLCAGGDDKNKLVCVDHFDLFQTDAGRARWKTFNDNIKSTGLSDRVRVMPEFSTPALFKLICESVSQGVDGYGLIYIDGSHRADDTLLDAEMAWRITDNGCIFIFDDYEWNEVLPSTIDHPKSAIEGFLEVHAGEYELLHKGYQVMILKKVSMRSGFLLNHNSIL